MHIFVFESKTIKPVSLNAAFATLRNGRRVRSKPYCQFAKDMKLALRERQFEWKAFESHFNPKIHEIHASLWLGVPELYTKQGAISLRSGDIANYEKVITDCIVTGKIDDAYITYWEMRKLPASEPFFKLSLEIITR